MGKQNKWIYLAGPLFSKAEQIFNKSLCDKLESDGYEVYLPQRECEGLTQASDIYQKCVAGVKGAGLVLAVLDGADADSGTCFEMGFAHANNIPIVGLRTDFRGSGDDGGLNLMLTQSCQYLIISSFEKCEKENTTVVMPGDDYYLLLVEKISEIHCVGD
jgi:nucleoside 2-deoxyribosyltransferase